MKLIHFFLSFFVFVCLCGAELENSKESRKLIEKIEEKHLKELDVDSRPLESKIGPLLGVVDKEVSAIIQSVQRSKKKKKIKNAILHPNAEALVYVNGYLTHVSNYPQTVIYTELEGPFYGTQTTVNYNGVVLYVNYDYDVEYTQSGVVFHHFYSDSEVITGSNQIIRFYR